MDQNEKKKEFRVINTDLLLNDIQRQEVVEYVRRNTNDEENEFESIENELKRLQNLNFQQDIDLRKRYALRIFILISAWMGFVGFYLLLHGFNCINEPQAVLITLITTTTVNVIGLFVIVASYIYPKNG